MKSLQEYISLSEAQTAGHFEVAYSVFDKNDRIVSKRKEFKTADARKKFIEKLKKDPKFYEILSYLDEDAKIGIALNTQGEIDAEVGQIKLAAEKVYDIRDAGRWKSNAVFQVEQAVAGWNSALKAASADRKIRLLDLQNQIEELLDSAYVSLGSVCGLSVFALGCLSTVKPAQIDMFVKYAKPLIAARKSVEAGKPAKFSV